MSRTVFLGGVAATLSLFPLSAALALSYRFPIPLGGYATGWEAVLTSQVAILFYGFFGAFPAAALLGGFGGVIAERLAGTNKNMRRNLLIIFSVFSAFIVSGILSILDKIIGPW